MKFKYIPDAEGPEETVLYGIAFDAGKAVEVAEDFVYRGVKVCPKLEGNPVFEVVKERAKKSKVEKIESAPSVSEDTES